MKVVKNKILPCSSFGAINLFGVIFIRHEMSLDERLICHEAIHAEQMKYLLYIFFYLLYFSEWLFRLFQYRNLMDAYYNISFEREAYCNDVNPGYVQERGAYDWIKYLRFRDRT